MHELTIVLNIFEIAGNQLKEHQGNKIDAIELEIGLLAGIEMEAFHFAWNAALPGSVLEDCSLKINPVEAEARCRHCHLEYDVSSLYDACPGCGSFRSELIRGKDLRIQSLVIS
ncbi:MAG: hydrogenase maturation nickel metallochaperone HypA [Saprospiraceae bacterium]|nr:hydrogenase maturation nickel metallochaperone HypA [Saprospiraceae bacterium]